MAIHGIMCGSPTCAVEVTVHLPLEAIGSDRETAVLESFGWVHQAQDGELIARWYCPRCRD